MSWKGWRWSHFHLCLVLSHYSLLFQLIVCDKLLAIWDVVRMLAKAFPHNFIRFSSSIWHYQETLQTKLGPPFIPLVLPWSTYNFKTKVKNISLMSKSPTSSLFTAVVCQPLGQRQLDTINTSWTKEGEFNNVKCHRLLNPLVTRFLRSILNYLLSSDRRQFLVCKKI